MNNEATKAVQSGSTEHAYAWNFLADLGCSKQFSLTGSFPKGMTADNMNEEIDKIRSVFDRQQAKSAKLVAEQEIEQCNTRINAATEDLKRIDAKYEAKGGPTSAERTQRDSALICLANLAKDLEYKTSVLEKLKNEAK